jgi:hypothetical protein
MRTGRRDRGEKRPAYLLADPEEGVFIYCRDCAEREFGCPDSIRRRC